MRAGMGKEAWEYEGQLGGILEVFGKKSDSPEIELFREKVRTGRPYGGNELLRGAERLTGGQ